jgi:hypothetical protein
MQRAKNMPGGGVLCSESMLEAIGNGSPSPGSAALAFHFVELHTVSSCGSTLSRMEDGEVVGY